MCWSEQIKDFRFTYDKSDIEKKIFEARNNEFDIFEFKDDYILYKIFKSEQRSPNLNDLVLREEILGLIYERNKYEYNNTQKYSINIDITNHLNKK